MTTAEKQQAVLSEELIENLSAFSENRRAVYTFLARCYEKEIDEACATAVVGQFNFASDDAALTTEVNALKAALIKQDGEALEHLAVVFNRVFFGMGPRTAQKAFPYESVYTSDKGLMMQAAYAEVKQLYAANGFVKNPDFTEPEDHIALELSYMARLCEQAQGALQERDEDETAVFFKQQRAFLAHHLLNWVPSLVADMKGSAEEGFYWHLAQFTLLFLQDDLQALSEVLD